LQPAPNSPPAVSRAVSALIVELRGSNAARAQRAVRHLIGMGDPAVSELRALLRGLARPPMQREHISKLIEQLDDDRFEVRRAASNELERLGRAAKKALQRTLAEKPPLEVRDRVKRLLLAIERLPEPPDETLQLRAVQVLAGIGSAAAREQLQRLVDTSPNERVVSSATLSLARLRTGSR